MSENLPERKMDIKGIGSECVEWIQLAQIRIRG